MPLKLLFRTSESWMAILGVIGWAFAHFGLMPQDQFDKLVVPLVVYIVARVTGKVAKASIKEGQ